MTQTPMPAGGELPRRVQLSRKKGWRMPENTVSVARPGKWGNHFTIADFGRQQAVLNHRLELQGKMAIGAVDLSPLRGRNIACWCRLDEACHGDNYLDLANRETPNGK